MKFAIVIFVTFALYASLATAKPSPSTGTVLSTPPQHTSPVYQPPKQQGGKQTAPVSISSPAVLTAAPVDQLSLSAAAPGDTQTGLEAQAALAPGAEISQSQDGQQSVAPATSVQGNQLSKPTTAQVAQKTGNVPQARSLQSGRLPQPTKPQGGKQSGQKSPPKSG